MWLPGALRGCRESVLQETARRVRRRARHTLRSSSTGTASTSASSFESLSVAARAAPTFLASSVERCQQLKGQLSPRQKAKAPIITSADFTKDASLLPDPKKYEQWDTMFVSITRNEGVNIWKAQDPSEGA